MQSALKVTTSASTQKLPQHMQSGTAIRRCSVLCPTVNFLHVLKSGTAANMCVAMHRASLVTPWVTAPTQGARGWARLHAVCDVHRTSLVHKTAFELMEGHVQGMINCALSLRCGN